MIQYLALLRGVNIGDHIVKMEKLGGIFSEMGFSNVRTYIQTGNIFFETSESEKDTLRVQIGRQLERSFGFPLPVCLRTVQEIDTLLAMNPFKHLELTPEKRFAVIFLAKKVKIERHLPYFTPDHAYELIAMTETELFVVWHLKSGRPGSSYGALEKKFAVQGTTRFWHTFEKITKAAKA